MSAVLCRAFLVVFMLLGLCCVQTGAQECSCENLDNIVRQQSEMIEQLMAKVTAMESRAERKGMAVAFSVHMSKNDSDNQYVHSTEPILFHALSLNRGGGYNSSSGVFTAPVAGVYQFNLKVTHIPPGTLHVLIVANDKDFAEVSINGDSSHRDRSSVSAVVELVAGDRVWARRAARFHDAELGGGFGTMFSGVLITQL